MKKLIGILAVILFLVLPSPMAQAKSYTIDDIQIRGWVAPNGEILMNEIFTYTFDGEFSELTRSFPEKHLSQIERFEAYIVNEKNPGLGNITGESLQQLSVYREGQTYVAKMGENSTALSILYVYYMHGTVKSYETYSDIDIMFFESGFNHDIDFENVNISFVLPGDVGESNIYGFMHNREKTSQKVYPNGIAFETPQSTAYTKTSTRLFFPSFIMTEQTKRKDPAPLEVLVEREEKQLQSQVSKLEKIPLVSKINRTVGWVFLLLSIVMFVLPQRWFLLRGHLGTILAADPVYLLFVDQNGKRHPKSFLAGLFSMKEKGHIDVTLEPVAERFKGKPLAGEKTFSFGLNEENEALEPYEQSLVDWLFRLNDTKKKEFHFHDVAGINQGESDEKVAKHFYEKHRKFDEKHRAWHKEVNGLLKEAGTFTNVLPIIIKMSALLAIVILTVLTLVIDLQSAEKVAFFLCVSILMFFSLIWKPSTRWVRFLYFIYAFFTAVNTVDEELGLSLFMAYAYGVLLYSATPHAIITSKYALNVKRGIRSFKSQMKRGLPRGLSKEEQEQWLIRAYLLNEPNVKLPLSGEEFPFETPLAEVFKSGIDPLYFVQQTRGWTKNAGPTGTAHRSGGFRGGGGGGGGGGAGAR